MNQENSNKATSTFDNIYKILETALASEIILFLLGGIFVTNMHPVPLRILYWFIIPWALLITALLYLILRNIRSRRALWALYGPNWGYTNDLNSFPSTVSVSWWVPSHWRKHFNHQTPIYSAFYLLLLKITTIRQMILVVDIAIKA